MKWIYFVIYLSLSFFFLIQWCKLQLGLYIRDHRGKSKLFTIQTRHNHKFLESCELKAPIYTAISRKVVGKNVHATTPKGNMGYDQYTVSNDCSCRTYFCCFLLALTNVCPWPLVPFFQNSLENRADKTTHNTFRDCRVRFFRQPFSKQLYIYVNILADDCQVNMLTKPHLK